MTYGHHRIATPAPERPAIHHSNHVRRLERIETIIEKLRAVKKYAASPEDDAALERALVAAREVWARWEPLVRR